MSKVINPNVAGIDIASRIHVVAISEEKDLEPVRTFECYTSDLRKLVSWLLEKRIESVAMESTGVYWYHLYTMLVDADIEVILVNAYHFKNVPGRKSDPIDARWLMKLHSFGLLSGCFQP